MGEIGYQRLVVFQERGLVSIRPFHSVKNLCFTADMDSHSNSELFWKKMTLGLWALNDSDPDDPEVKAKEEEIISKNIQFNLQTQPSVALKDNLLVEQFKDVTTITPINDSEPPDKDESPVKGPSQNFLNTPHLNYPYFQESPLNDEGSVFNKDQLFSGHSLTEKVKTRKKVERDFKNNYLNNDNNFYLKDFSESPNNINNFKKSLTPKQPADNFIDINSDEEDLSFQKMHEVNAGTHKYVYTDPAATQSIKPRAFQFLNEEGNTDTTTGMYDKVYKDQALTVIEDLQGESSKDDIKEKMLQNDIKETKQLKVINNEINRNDNDNFNKNDFSNSSNNLNKDNKLDDFMGPYMEENLHGNIHNADRWYKWFKAFLPKEEDIGHNYQQELLGKMFPKSKLIQDSSSFRPENIKIEEHTEDPRLLRTEKSHGLRSGSHDHPKQSHDHGNDYAPLDLNFHSWQSITPTYANKHLPRFHKGPSHFNRGDKPYHSGYRSDTLPHRQKEPQENPRKERYSFEVYGGISLAM